MYVCVCIKHRFKTKVFISDDPDGPNAIRQVGFRIAET